VKKLKIAALLLGAGLIALLAVGCGSSGDSTTDSTATLTKAEFVKEGNEVCAAGNKEINAGFEKFAKENNLKGEPNEAQFAEAAETILIPSVSGQVEEIKALGAPEGEEEAVEDFLTGAEETLEEVEEDPTLISGEPFEKTNKEAVALGLKTCAEE
jgi:hypothetical protein